MVAVIPPPYVITAADKRGLVVVITATILSFVWTCLLIRVWLRWKRNSLARSSYRAADCAAVDCICGSASGSPREFVTFDPLCQCHSDQRTR